ELEKRLELLKERLPNEKETPRLYRTLSEAATQSGLAVSLFQPRSPKEQDYYYEIPIAITAEGGYHQLGEFFERVAALPRVVTLAEMKLTGLTAGTSTGRPLRVDVTLATYMYRPAGAGAPPKPGAPAVPAPKPGGAR
ncbi:MAG: type 4a pilus biogenesis protein PilO, partial [Candidatus Rokubacteria bacterium]|nr:type 4a pilus biogenesis protein PilO [Candidatus Rokubacteria bacterium]